MNSCPRPLLGILALLLLFARSDASAQTVVLQADFDHDTIGEMPATDLAGAPDGDFLISSVSGGTISVESSFSSLNEQPVVLTRQLIDEFYLAFVVDPDLQNCQTYTISWSSVLDRHSEDFYLAFGSPNARLIGTVEFRPEGLMTTNDRNVVLQSTYNPMTVQNFEVQLDFKKDTMSISIDGVPDPGGQNLAFFGWGPDGLRIISLEFAGVDDYTVAFDNLRVTSADCTEVATEKRSWGALKSNFY